MTPSLHPAALVTGASGGIGSATALQLHQDGYAIVAQYRSRSREIDQLRQRIEQTGGQCWPVKSDLAEAQGVPRLIDAVRSLLTSHPGLELQALVNNAGKVLGPGFGEVTAAAFDDYFNLNVRVPLLLTQGLIEMFVPGGAVVNISSVAAHFSSPSDIVYAMTKAALESFTANAAEALSHRQLRINTVVPGFTDNGHPLFRDPTVLARLSELPVLGGISQPASVASAISFLLSTDASRITGATLDVSGGSALGAQSAHRHRPSLRDLAKA